MPFFGGHHVGPVDGSSSAHESGDSRRGFIDFRVGVWAAGLDGVGDAVPKMVVEKADGYGFERLVHC